MRLTLLVVLSVLTASGYSQTFRFTYETGYGVYGLDNMKKYQETLTHQINGLPVKMIAQFPDYFNHSVSAGIYLDKNVIVGLNACYLTTGGRNSIRDYSGEYKLDMLLNAYQYGMESEYISHLGGKWDMNFNFKMGVVSSTLNVDEFFEIYNVDSHEDKQSVNQISVFMEPNLNVSYTLIRGIAVKVGLGFNLNTVNLQGAMLDWTGFRPRIGIAYSL